MANTTITNLPTVTSLDGTEPLLGVQSSSSVQITTGQIVSLATGGGGVSPLSVIAGGTGDTTLTAYGLMYGNGTAPVGSVSPPAGTNYVLIGSSGSAPTWSPTIPVTAGVDSISFGTTGLSPSTDTAGVITVAGTLNIANGGTGITSFGTGVQTALGQNVTGSGSIVLGTAPTITSPVITGGSINNTPIGATTASTGAFTYLSTSSYTSTTPTLSFNASNSPISSGATVSGSYLQFIIQNQSATAGASTNYVLSNDSGTDSTYYGEFGMNSSVYSASTPADFFSINNSVYFSAHDGDVAIGSSNGFKTYFAWGATATGAHVINASGALGFSTNLGTTPALSGTTGFGSSGQALITGGSAAAPAWGTLGISGGGTGQAAALTQYGVVYGASTTAMGITAAGTTGQVLIATTSGAPSWGAIPSTAAVTSITFGTTGLTPSTATTGAVTVAGTLATANGGTNLTTFTAANNAIYSTSASVLTAGTLPVAAGGTGQSSALTQYGVVYGSTTSAMATSAAGTTGQVLIGTASAAPSWTNALTAITTLTATGAITHNTTSNNQSYTTTGAGTITISSGTLGTINNMTIGGTTRAAGNFTFVGAGLGSSTSAFVTTAAGTTSVAPIVLTSGGSLLATPVQGAIEYDGIDFYGTGTINSGRGYVPVTQYFKLTASGSAIGAAIANYFAATSGTSLDASGYYELEAELFFTKTTAGTVTFTLTFSNAPISASAYYVGTPVGGIGTVGSPQTAAVINSTATGTAMPVTGSLTTAVNHQYKIYAIFQANATTAGSLNLQITSSAGTVTPLVLSNYKVRRLPAANTGNFV